MNSEDDRHLDDDDDVVDPRRLLDADDQQDRHRATMSMAGRLTSAVGVATVRRAAASSTSLIAREPPAGRGVRTASASGTLIIERPAMYWAGCDAEVVQEAHDVARPADGDGGGAERVFEDQVPADDPGDELAHRRIGIGVGAARDRDGGGHLGVAEPGEGAGDAGEDEREARSPARRSRAAACPVSTKMPAPMMAPMPSATRLVAVSVRLSGTPPWVTRAWTSVSCASACRVAIDFLASSRCMFPSVDGRGVRFKPR